MLGSRDDGHALALARGLRGSEIATWQHAGEVLPRCCLPSGSGWMGHDSQSFDRDIQNAVKSISIQTPVRTSWRRTERNQNLLLLLDAAARQGRLEGGKWRPNENHDIKWNGVGVSHWRAIRHVLHAWRNALHVYPYREIYCILAKLIALPALCLIFRTHTHFRVAWRSPQP